MPNFAGSCCPEAAVSFFADDVNSLQYISAVQDELSESWHTPARAKSIRRENASPFPLSAHRVYVAFRIAADDLHT